MLILFWCSVVVHSFCWVFRVPVFYTSLISLGFQEDGLLQFIDSTKLSGKGKGRSRRPSTLPIFIVVNRRNSNAWFREFCCGYWEWGEWGQYSGHRSDIRQQWRWVFMLEARRRQKGTFVFFPLDIQELPAHLVWCFCSPLRFGFPSLTISDPPFCGQKLLSSAR